MHSASCLLAGQGRREVIGDIVFLPEYTSLALHGSQQLLTCIAQNPVLHLQMIVGAYETRLQDSAAEAADLRHALASLQQEYRTLENRQAAQMQRIAAASNLVGVGKQSACRSAALSL